MKIIVQPQKGSSYKLLFYDGRHVLGAGYVDLTDTPRGPRPTKYRFKWGGKKEYRHTPSKELVAQLREAGFVGARSRRLMPGESFHAFFGRKPA